MNHPNEFPSNVVRAWMDTVLLPLWERIELDIKQLKAENWTWQYYPGDFEYLKPIADYIESKAKLNLRQMLEAEEKISVSLEKRDRALCDLQNACSTEAGLYRHSVVLQKRISTLLEEAQDDLGPRIAGGREGQLEWQDRDYIIEYLVNNRGDLPSYYVLSRFWSTHRDQLFELVEGEQDLREAKSKTREAGKSLLLLDEELQNHLWKRINSWSLSYNLPIATPTT